LTRDEARQMAVNFTKCRSCCVRRTHEANESKSPRIFFFQHRAADDWRVLPCAAILYKAPWRGGVAVGA
jgi:hypothetical protein